MPRERDRVAIVEAVRRHEIERGYPRLVMLLVLASSGAAAFVCSVALLRVGVASMTIRYPVSALVGYLAFVLAIRAWIAYRRNRRSSDADFPEGVDGGSRSDSSAELFGGGRSGGGGGSAGWGDTSRHASEGVLDLDADELWPVALAVVAALCVALTLGYVVYAAPIMLAELAVDAALVGAVYGRVRKRDVRGWFETTLRHTWRPACAAVALAAASAWAMERIAPGATSIGQVLAAW